MSEAKTAVIFMADGMEMCECLLTVDILRRANVNVITASVMGHKRIITSHQVMVYADKVAEEVDFKSADMLILPGGRVGTENLWKSDIVQSQVPKFAADPEKYVAAICAAPSILSGLGLLDDRRATCHPGFTEVVMMGSSYRRLDESNLDPALNQVPDTAPLVNLTHESVTVDGNIITGQALGATTEFALCLTEILAGKETAEEVAKSICWKH